jgi:2-hydroxy-3-keto-5-methylthiopentenyl-1-phosphate phosphatase
LFILVSAADVPFSVVSAGLVCLATGVLQNLVARIQCLEMSTAAGRALPPCLEYVFTMPIS